MEKNGNNNQVQLDLVSEKSFSYLVPAALIVFLF